MLSILIIDGEIFDHYSKYEYFLDRFEAEGDVAVCVWNKGAGENDIAAMVPQLMDTIKNIPAWNAYIICAPHHSIDFLQDDFNNKTQYAINPYERANREDYCVEKDPLLNLVYLLGGRGESSYSFDNGIRQEHNIKYIEQYQFRAARPDSIFLITPRIFKNISQQKHFLLTEIQDEYAKLRIQDNPKYILAGEIDVTTRYSEFWERYKYPSNCRFLVYDLPEEQHQKYEDSWFPFWICILTLTKNYIGNSILAPYKLHLLDIEINDDKFAEYFNKFYTMLLDNRDISEHEIKAEKDAIKLEASSTDITVSNGKTAPVYVTFPHVDVANLFASKANIGLVKDRPVLDEEDWRRQMQRTRETVAKFFKAIGRGKGEAVDYTNDTFEADRGALVNKRITKYDAEELRDAMNEDELRMIELNTGYAASRAEFEKEQRKADRIVRTYMKRRLKFKTAAWLIAACMLIYFLGFIPFMINSVKHSLTSFLVAWPISAAAFIVPLVSGIIALAVLKRRMNKLIDLYNNTINSCYEKAKTGAEIQGEYLSLLLDYMKKYQLLSNSIVDNSHSQRIDELVLAIAVFDDAIIECEALAALRNIKLKKITDRYVENTIASTPGSHISLYEDNENGTMSLNEVPDALSAPFSFTDDMSIIAEELYECVGYTKRKASNDNGTTDEGEGDGSLPESQTVTETVEEGE